MTSATRTSCSASTFFRMARSCGVNSAAALSSIASSMSSRTEPGARPNSPLSRSNSPGGCSRGEEAAASRPARRGSFRSFRRRLRPRKGPRPPGEPGSSSRAPPCARPLRLSRDRSRSGAKIHASRGGDSGRRAERRRPRPPGPASRRPARCRRASRSPTARPAGAAGKESTFVGLSWPRHRAFSALTSASPVRRRLTSAPSRASSPLSVTQAAIVSRAIVRARGSFRHGDDGALMSSDSFMSPRPAAPRVRRARRPRRSGERDRAARRRRA